MANQYLRIKNAYQNKIHTTVSGAGLASLSVEEDVAIDRTGDCVTGSEAKESKTGVRACIESDMGGDVAD